MTGTDISIDALLTIEYSENKSFTKNLCLECNFPLESLTISIPFKVQITIDCEANGDAWIISDWGGGYL